MYCSWDAAYSTNQYAINLDWDQAIGAAAALLLSLRTNLTAATGELGLCCRVLFQHNSVAHHSSISGLTLFSDLLLDPHTPAGVSTRVAQASSLLTRITALWQDTSRRCPLGDFNLCYTPGGLAWLTQ
jgi:hypothetical protein